MAAMNARVASGELATAANADGVDAQPDQGGMRARACVDGPDDRRFAGSYRRGRFRR
jgi:hypothetical protein